MSMGRIEPSLEQTHRAGHRPLSPNDFDSPAVKMVRCCGASHPAQAKPILTLQRSSALLPRLSMSRDRHGNSYTPCSLYPVPLR